MFNKIQNFVRKFQSVVGLIAALLVAVTAFNEEMKKHYTPEETKL